MANTLQAILPTIGQLMAERPLVHPIEIVARSIHDFFIKITQRTPDAEFETSVCPEGLTHLAAFPLTLTLEDSEGLVSEMILNIPQGDSDVRA